MYIILNESKDTFCYIGSIVNWMRPEDTLETNCSIQVDVSCWDRTGVPTPSHTFQSNITLSCQYIRIHYFYYHFILSANSCSFLSLSLYLFSTFMFILIIITLSFQKETQRWFFLCNPGSINSVRTHFVFPLIFYLGQLTLIFLFIFWYWRKWWLWQLNFSSLSTCHQRCWPRPSLPLMWSLKKFRRGRGTNFLHLFYILVWGSIES